MLQHRQVHASPRLAAMASTDREVLAALFRSTSGATWTQNRNWGKDVELSQWHGVGVNKQDRVVMLCLQNNNLQGTIPRELGRLTDLRFLYLLGNGLAGPIPAELGSLGALEVLALERNILSGEIPASLGQLDNLRLLCLDNNQLGGAIPEELGNVAALTELWLQKNNLEGSIPKELGALSKLKKLGLSNNDLTGSTPKELGDLWALTNLALHHNKIIGAPNPLLTGGSLARWREKLRGIGRKEPWAISAADFLVNLWHFCIPIFDDVTDVILLFAMSEDRGRLWWACCVAFVLADVERVLLIFVTVLLILCWVPFALIGTDESRGERFKVALRVLNGGHDLRLEGSFVRRDARSGASVWGNRPAALRWPILDGLLWVVIGSRSKSSSLMRFWGLAGNTPVGVLEQSGFGLSLIDKMVECHPYRMLGSALFCCPHGHRLPGSGAATRRSWVMLRAVGETLVVDSLFLSLSLSSETWDDGVTIGGFSLIFSVLELLTELQYYAAEARADMVVDEEETTGMEMDDRHCDRHSIEEVVNRAPSRG